ncbi:16S rRNA (guanine(966)-N(2))-methyltransferase RsmD [Gluconacetobacter takamatsuzukensis]|uniref:16S rRNA (Guanine(966)-N(2))-methyltransferase RsmD n=1 Tax=Gluconacetobacter takamatsuzukensis TaxID=1286190 RepID=A0A7W4PNH7_9PROT|nr:16S rRNA (guanine(966)-N(2))-methyltransferase RsmD [Gluconacetobacter takamatsuzukensis]MBB2204113.1 16S rRNA (guanine(966)-N(2))-methyltransferase RsmD [Gluconacetobacter takamatsuzukensis]
MRIVAGQWRGRALVAPPGRTTRPTADRVRQALFDMLLHAPWGGYDLMAQAHVLDGFAGTGALGLEALSRGAVHCTFFETDRAALAALRANIAACRAAGRTTLRGDITRPPAAARPCDLLLLDPPYGQGLPERALAALSRTGWIALGALVVIETGADEPLPTCAPILPEAPLAERHHGAARLSIWRAGAMPQ